MAVSYLQKWVKKWLMSRLNMSKQSQGQPSYRPADACAQGKHGGAAALQQTWLPGAVRFIRARTARLEDSSAAKRGRGGDKSRYLLPESSMSKVRTPSSCVKHTRSRTSPRRLQVDSSPVTSQVQHWFRCATHRSCRRLGARHWLRPLQCLNLVYMPD